ncbi:MAG: hypothetical protein HY043_23050 [Verrucomicrobia bacterium]|nr:hypothetical protein [Verrucomicrobiota bacterium]
MAKAPFMPKDDPGKCQLLSNIAQKLPGYSATVGVTAAEVAATTADNAFFAYICDAKNQYAQKALDWTAYKNNARDGTVLGALPAAPTLGPAPALVPPNIFGRLAALVARVKKHPGYTDAIGQDLGLIGAEQTVDLNSMKPILDLTLQAGHPNIGWTKQGMDGLEIWVDRGTGTFTFLAIDTIPDYLDTAALPAAGTSAVWKYKAIYRLHDEQVGQWSDVISVSVMG